MSLTRIWTPSGNYSGGGSKRLLVIHTMEGFTGANGAYDCAKYFQSDCGASSQVCIDNNRGKIWECVSRGNGAWTQCNYNSVSVSVEQSGYASWSRDYWLTNRDAQLHNVADWLAEESDYFGIPLVKLSSSQAQGSGRGICYHSDLGSAGCGHGDPGANWPLDKVLEWAKGGTFSPEQPQEVHEMPTVLIPPRRDVSWSLDSTSYTAVGLFADCGRLGAGTEVKVRVALHQVDGGWTIHDNIVLSQSKPKWSTGFPKNVKIDSVGFYRSDDNPIDMYPNVI